MIFLLQAVAETPSAGESALRFFILMVPALLIFWFLVVRPQRKEEKKKKAMISNLQKGDEILTTSGLYAKIKSIDSEKGFVYLSIAEGVTLKYALSAVDKKVD